MVSTLRLRHWSPLALAVTIAVLLATFAVPVAAATGRWIVPAGTPLPTGSTVVGSFPVADAMVVESAVAPAGAVDINAPVTMQSLPGVPTTYNGVDVEIDTGIAATNAPAVWELPEFGEQAVVALVDTGVAPEPVLEGAVAGEIDFTGTGGGDGYGHGTFLASLIAGRGEVAPGVAPEAGILSLKVADAEGAATLGSVMSALQWLHGPGASAGIRIATLAFGVDPDSDAAHILDHAADAVAAKGLLVVTATGNDPREVSSPATATHTLSVGAVSASNTAGDLATFSGSGNDRVGIAQPDVTAPGVNIAGALPEDSVIAQEATELSAEDGYGGMYHGSGTSMSTALVAGVAALASSANPALDGDGLAAALDAGDGHFVDAAAAVEAAAAMPSRGTPVHSAPWASEPASHPANANGKSTSNGPADQVEPTGLRWTGLRWTGLRWTGLRWTGLRWTGLRWTGLRWTGLRWTGTHWGDADWAFGKWAGLRWTDNGWVGPDAEATPAGLRWTGLRWTGLRWTGLRWTGLRWTGLRWTGLRWTGLRWTGLRWTMLEAEGT